MISSGCESVPGNQPQTIDVFDQERYCVKKLDQVSFYDYQRAVEAYSNGRTFLMCKSGYILCGNDQDVNEAFCIPASSNQSCPLTNVAFSYGAPRFNESGPTKASISGLIFSELQPCIDSSQWNRISDSWTHPLATELNNGGCTRRYANLNFSPHSRIVDGFRAVSQYTVYKENDNILEKLDDVNAYKTSIHKDHYYNLYQ